MDKDQATPNQIDPIEKAKCNCCGSEMISIKFNALTQKAVNCHDELVGALKLAKPYLDYLADSGNSQAHEDILKIEQALAKADGA